MNEETPEQNELDSIKIEHERDLIDILNKRRELTNLLIDNFKEHINSKHDALLDKMTKQYTNIKEINMKAFPKTYHLMMSAPRKTFVKYLQAEEIIRTSIDYSLQNYSEYLDTIDIQTTDDTTGLYIGNSLINERLVNDKYDYSDYNFNKNELFDINLKTVLQKKTNSQKMSYAIYEETLKDKDNNTKDKEKNKKFIHDNSNVLLSLELNNIKKDIDTYFDTTKKTTFKKLKSMQFNDCIFEGMKESDVYRFDKLESLEYINSLPANIEKIQQFIPFNISSQLNLLTILKFEKANIVNSEFQKIMGSIIAMEDLRRQIKIISFAENQLTSIDFKKKFSLSAVKTFDSLEEFNFSSNRLYSFRISYTNSAKQLKFVNLIDNHFSSLAEIDQPKDSDCILFLCNRNLFLTSDVNLTKYTESLRKILPSFFYENLTYMTFSGLFHRDNCRDLLSFEINPAIYGSLTELDLSYCGLSTSVVLDYLKKSTKLVSLKTLNLKANFIEIDFFKRYNEEYDINYLMYLENVNLSNNSIKDEDFNEVYQFIVKNRNLKLLNLQMNVFGKEYHVEKPKAKESNTITSGFTPGKEYIPQSDERVSNISEKGQAYVVRLPDRDSSSNFSNSKKMNFIELIKALYYPEPIPNAKPFKTFYLDFSTDSRLIDSLAYEKNKKKGPYVISLKKR